MFDFFVVSISVADVVLDYVAQTPGTKLRSVFLLRQVQIFMYIIYIAFLHIIYCNMYIFNICLKIFRDKRSSECLIVERRWRE